MIDIILSSYNGERFIKEQIGSILRSEYRDFRLFVFDDMSSDDTAAIVGSFEKEDPERVSLIKNAYNKGFCRNFLEGLIYAVKNAPADYYVFCDQDDVWFEDRLDICLNRMKQFENEYGAETPAMLFTDALIVNEDLESAGTTFFRAGKLNTSRLDMASELMENRCIGCTSFMNHALASMITAFDPRIRYHDWWAALTATAFGKLIYLDVPTVLYRQHGSNQVGQTAFAGYAIGRASEPENARKRIIKTIAQASAFHKQFADRLPDDRKRLLREFIAIGYMDGIERRRLILKNRFYKSGFLRNIGMLLIV